MRLKLNICALFVSFALPGFAKAAGETPKHTNPARMVFLHANVIPMWRSMVANGEVLGPTIFSTGPIFYQKRTAEEDIRLVDEQAAAGYNAIKVYNEVSKDEYPALITEAKRQNLLLMGHVA